MWSWNIVIVCEEIPGKRSGLTVRKWGGGLFSLTKAELMYRATVLCGRLRS